MTGMTFLSGGYGFPMHDQNEPPQKGPRMSNREAWRKIRPRGWKDRKTLIKLLILVAVIFGGIVAVGLAK